MPITIDNSAILPSGADSLHRAERALRVNLRKQYLVAHRLLKLCKHKGQSGVTEQRHLVVDAAGDTPFRMSITVEQPTALVLDDEVVGRHHANLLQSGILKANNWTTRLELGAVRWPRGDVDSEAEQWASESGVEDAGIAALAALWVWLTRVEGQSLRKTLTQCRDTFLMNYRISLVDQNLSSMHLAVRSFSQTLLGDDPNTGVTLTRLPLFTTIGQREQFRELPMFPTWFSSPGKPRNPLRVGWRLLDVLEQGPTLPDPRLTGTRKSEFTDMWGLEHDPLKFWNPSLRSSVRWHRDYPDARADLAAFTKS